MSGTIEDLEVMPPGANHATMLDHIDRLEYRHRRIFELLDRKKLGDSNEMIRFVTRLGQIQGHGDFDDAERGASYRAKQLAAPRSREHGDRAIFAEIERRLGGFNFSQIGLDVIGGNGTLARVAAALLPAENRPYIIAGDPCLDQVNDALSHDLPAVWQSADETMFADDSIDFVVGSRGFHHVGVETRPTAFAEAWRILKPGGVVFMLDFEEGSPTARWYSDGLDRYTNTGHDFAHFRRAGFLSLLEGAGFAEASVFDLYDPFRFWAPTEDAAREMLLDHLVEMFGMVKLRRRPEETRHEAFARIEQTMAPWCTFTAAETAFDPAALRRLTVVREPDGRWRAEFPRVALCAVGVKR